MVLSPGAGIASAAGKKETKGFLMQGAGWGAARAEPAEQAPGGGVPPGVGGSTSRCGAQRGACLLCRLPTPPLVYFVSPYPPLPPSPAGKGGTISFFRRGLRPRHPGTYLLTALTDHAEQLPNAREPAVQRKADRRSFLRAAPAAKERGDRGRWNYPSLTRRRRLRWSSPPGQG